MKKPYLNTSHEKETSCDWLFLLLFSLVQPVSAEQSLHLMANTSPPYADQQLPEQGLALELVREVFSRTGHTPEITIENWARARLVADADAVSR